MKIKEITNKSDWNNFILEAAPNTFLHSWEWGQVQRSDGEKVTYLGLFNEAVQIGACLLILVRARRGAFYLCPHGPILISGSYLADAVHAIKEYAGDSCRADAAAALRIAPLWESNEHHRQIFLQEGFRPAPLHMHAELTWVLDIDKDENQLLAGMRKTTRHAIKKAKKEGVSIEFSTDAHDIERFWPLYEQTKDRHDFVPFSKQFLTAQANQFAAAGNFLMAFAKHRGEDVVGAILVQFGRTVFYHHGASKKLPSSVPAAQLLHWEAIKMAKKRGATLYNFWGISSPGQKRHPFAGITVFKTGFGGRAIDYMHAQDLPLSLRYWKLWLVDSWRKFRRGF